MATPQEKAQRVSWFVDTKSDLQTLRNFRTKYGGGPSVTSINSCMAQEIYGDRDKRTSEKNIEYSLDVLRAATNGAHIEVY